MLLTYKFRVKDKHATELSRQARAVNLVWNFCEETQRSALKWAKKWPSGYDLQKLTAGSGQELDVHAHTVQRVCSEYEKSRRTHKKRSLRWRGKKSLGWVPFNSGHVTHKDGAFYFRRMRFDVWLSRELPDGAKIGAGSFNQDSKGHWYINLPLEITGTKSLGTSAIGIDLGLKSLAVTSAGETVEAQRFYRDMEPALAVAQRAGNKKRVKAIHAKIANRRKDHLHKLSTRLVHEHGAIFVGNVNAAGLAKTTMAKSVLDAGWSTFRTMLEYKSHQAQVWFAEVNEAWSTQTCHECGTNSASNILVRGLDSIAGGTCHDR